MCVFMPGFDPFASICHMVSFYCLTLHLKSVTVCNHTLFVDGGDSTLTEASSYREVQWQRLSVFVLAGAPGVQHDLRLHCQCTRPHRGKHLSCSWQTQERTPALTVKVCKFCCPCIWDLSTCISTCPSLLTGCSMLFHSGMFVIHTDLQYRVFSLWLQDQGFQKSKVTWTEWRFLELFDYELFSARLLESCSV